MEHRIVEIYCTDIEVNNAIHNNNIISQHHHRIFINIFLITTRKNNNYLGLKFYIIHF